MTLVAYIDESTRNGPDGRFYLMAAAIINERAVNDG
jgi:hypothetical protein